LDAELLVNFFLIDFTITVVVGAYVAGRWAKKQWTRWLSSKEADPYVDRVAGRAAELAEARIRPLIPNTPDIKAEIDPIRATIAEMDQKLYGTFQALKAEIDAVPGRLREEIQLDNARRAQEIYRATKEEGEDLQERVEGLAQYGDDPYSRELRSWLAKPVDPKLEEKNPIGALVLRLGKGALAKELQGALGSTPGIRVTRKGGDSLYG
jgi:hypothetical protein